MVEQKFLITVEVVIANDVISVTDIRHHIDAELRALSEQFHPDDWRKEVRYNVVKGGRILE